ncbi:hypothetical protein BVH01_10910 [Pseudomonas sp. PA1(2017)]|nr:hypothetical protein BVH01_10910 [Pseudomonas sp. PA1(2017)]OLU31020.1 hypothetical protein BVH06_13705 [Pseudomonas sp. PA27(2017)]
MTCYSKSARTAAHSYAEPGHDTSSGLCAKVMFEYKKRTFGTKRESMHNCVGASSQKGVANGLHGVLRTENHPQRRGA